MDYEFPLMERKLILKMILLNNKFKLLILLVVLITTIILGLGCSNTGEKEYESATICIGEDEDEYIIDDSDSLNVIKEYIEAGKKQEGISDYIIPAPYQISISYSDNREEVVYLYKSDEEKNSIYVLDEDKNVGYTVDQDTTNKLEEIINGLNENSDIMDN
ncbi:hypothetical protein [Vallitalea longa]|nr:hypothetical protein [Vallitalea longa]